MAQTLPLPHSLNTRANEQAISATQTIPWYIWSCLIAIASGTIGGAWDISWHESVGRDSFWTTPHMFIYFSGILAGLSCAYLILSITFNKNHPLRDSSVTMWGCRGPLGGFIVSWGAAAMITSAPFDNWWHNAYGLDVKILSPPHVLLALGMMGIRFGAVVLALAEMNRAVGEYRVKLERMFMFLFVFLIAACIGMAQEYTIRVFMHSARFYLVVMLIAPIWMATITVAAKSKWAATIMTGSYALVHLCFTLIFPLVPAQPKLGPVYQNVTHLVPPDFPLLLIVGAIAIDLVRSYITGWNRWAQAAVIGIAFFGAFVAAQWPFANFLMSPAAHNWFFNSGNYPYFIPSTSPWVRNVYVYTDNTSQHFWIFMTISAAVAIFMTRVGLAWGDWMQRIRR
jgi:hypothetical protein